MLSYPRITPNKTPLLLPLTGLAVLALSALGACAPGEAKEGLDPTTPEAAVVSVTADRGTIAVGEVVTVRATARTSDDQPAPAEVDWSASGGAVVPLSDSTAQFSAASAGTYRVRGRGRKSPHPQDSTAVVVTDPVSPIVSISVTPASATLPTGGLQAFVASGTRADGTTLTPSVTWSATGGTISASGIYSAGGTAGSFRVIATQQGGTLADTAAITITAPVLQAVILTPSSASLATGNTQQFSVSGQWSNGATTAPAVTYSATGGTVTAGGLYTAGSTAGTYRVIATQQGGTLADTAAVTLTAPVLQAVILTPSSASLATGGTQQFTVSGQWSNGATTAPAVTYSATGGTVTAGGLYTAGSTAGSFRVIATQQGGSLADSSVVTITAPSGGAAECAAPRPEWIWCDDFEQNRTSSYFEYDASGGQFARSAGVGHAGSYGMRAAFAPGQVSAGSLHLAFGRTPQAAFRPVDAGTANYREIYWRIYLRHQAGWTGGGGDKLSRVMIFASPTSWAQAMIGHLWSGGAPDENFLIMDPASGTDQAGNLVTTRYNDFANLRWLGIVRGNTPLYDAAHVGTWYCIEAHVRLNTAGAADGYMEFWIDGVLEGRTPNQNWIGSYSGYGMNALFLENYWNSGSPVAQERYMDRFVVSTARIGC